MPDNHVDHDHDSHGSNDGGGVSQLLITVPLGLFTLLLVLYWLFHGGSTPPSQPQGQAASTQSWRNTGEPTPELRRAADVNLPSAVQPPAAGLAGTPAGSRCESPTMGGLQPCYGEPEVGTGAIVAYDKGQLCVFFPKKEGDYTNDKTWGEVDGKQSIIAFNLIPKTGKRQLFIYGLTADEEACLKAKARTAATRSAPAEQTGDDDGKQPAAAQTASSAGQTGEKG